MFVFHLFCLSVLFAANNVAASNKGLSIHIQELNIDADKEFLMMNTKLRKENGENVVDVDIDLHKEIDDPIYIESEILTRAAGSNDYVTFLKGTNVAICDFFEHPKLNPMLALIIDALNKYGNKFSSCPIKKAKFNITGFRMDPETIPSFVPGGDYRIVVKTTRLVGAEYKQLYSFICDTHIEKNE